MPIAVFGLTQTFLKYSAHIWILKEIHPLKTLKSNAFVRYAIWKCPAWTLSVWFDFFESVKCDTNSKISQNVQIFGFLKKKVGSCKACMISVNVEASVIQVIARKEISNLFKGTFVELSNLLRKLALSTNFDSWFTYRVLSQQNAVSTEFLFILYFEFFHLEKWKFSVLESKIAATPPPPPPFLTTEKIGTPI